MSQSDLTASVRKLKRLKAKQSELEEQISALEAAIKAHMGEREEVRAGEFRLLWKSIESIRLDTTALKIACPDIYALYAKPTQTRRFQVI